MTTCTTTLHGDDLAYEFHQGTGTPLLLVHGVGSSTKTWSEVLGRLLDAGRTVVAIDLLGHGESGHGNGDFSLGANASRIRDLLDATVALRDGKKITDMQLGFKEKIALKEVLKKIGGTEVEKLLKTHQLI